MPARLLAAVFLSAAAPPAAAGERYFVVMFGSQSTPRIARGTHTFVSAVRVTDGPAGPVLDTKTISWLPATLVIRALHLRPEPGVNLPLDASLGYVTGQNQRVSVWGPYQVEKSTYDRLVAQHTRVEARYYSYQAVDTVRPDPRVANCIHAVSDADPEYGRSRYPQALFGEPATHYIVRQFFQRGRVIDPAADHGWLLAALGVTRYPVLRREFLAPQGGPALDLGWRLRPTLD